MREELEKLNSKLKRIHTKKIPNTFLSIINKNFDEVTISKYVAFMLNPENTTLKVIEQILTITQWDKDEINFVQLFNDENTVFESIDIEEAISTRSRIDILIKFSNFWIAIENKINSYENNNQSLKYEEDLKKQTDLPIKYICLKPQYNHCELINKKFSYITYSQFVEVLKVLSKYELKQEENYNFIEDFIKHMEVFYMNENEFEISEDVELYIDNKEVIDNMMSNYKKQCGLVKDKLTENVEDRFGNDYSFYCSKYGYMQIWKNDWDNENNNGIHYEILCDFNNIIGTNIKVMFAIHNEGKTRRRFPEIIHQTVSVEKFNFDTSQNIESSINAIVEKIYNIAIENNEKIDLVLKSMNERPY